MRSATAFLPSSMMTLMNLVTSELTNFGSGRISRFGTSRRRGMGFLYFSRVVAPGPPKGPIVTGPDLLLTASPRTSRSSGAAARDIQLFGLRPLGSVLGAALLAVLHALRVQRAAHDVIAHPGQILDAAAADQHHRVLLQIM